MQWKGQVIIAQMERSKGTIGFYITDKHKYYDFTPMSRQMKAQIYHMVLELIECGKKL